ncbi:hypothetical protein FSP39_011658 [Pinctada imbricata]|uniref:Uncharacterized protein n=1 Tax=Pinctada imbricata TaxID=66713 RepID=A0AA88YIK8_PINIB|nr:hypothetical protein FSP39_011658 [Pinctada imbricata]
MDRKRTLDFLLKNVRCYLCLDQFRDPRLLDCHHSYCRKCLESYVATVSNEGVIECPLCDVETETPKKGVSQLEKNIYYAISQQEMGVSCAVCGEQEFAKGHCMDCNQDFCESCLKSHSGMTATREHHIVSIGRDNLGGKVTRNHFCKTHTEEKLCYFCTTCQKLVCQHCNMTNHKHHKSKYYTEITDVSRKRLKEVVSSMEYVNYFCWLAERKEEFSQQIQKYKKAEEKAYADVDTHAELLHSMVEQTRQKMLDTIADDTKKIIQPAKDAIKLIEKNILSITGIYLYARNVANQGDDVTVVDKSSRVRTKLEKMKSSKLLPTLEPNTVQHFVPHPVTVEEIQSIYGEIKRGVTETDDKKSECLMRFELDDEETTISSILPIEDGRAWLIEDVGGLLRLYDTEGRIHNTLRLGVQADDMAMTDDGTILVSCNSAKEIKAIDERLRIKSFVNTPYCARGLALDNKCSSLFICTTEKNAFFDHDATHNNQVVRTMLGDSKRWEVPDILEFSSSPTVEYPARAVVTKNGYIAISDWKRECVTILDGTGHIETEYFGLRKGRDNDHFCPRGICCSKSDGRLLVADYNTSRIIQIDETGQIFQTVLTKADGIHKPWSVSVGVDGLLWVGNKQGSVQVFQLQ